MNARQVVVEPPSEAILIYESAEIAWFEEPVKVKSDPSPLPEYATTRSVPRESLPALVNVRVASAVVIALAITTSASSKVIADGIGTNTKLAVLMSSRVAVIVTLLSP
jgi:hypothetical protein